MKTEAVMQLQVGDVLGMIGAHLGMKYNKKIISVKPIFKEITVFDNGQINDFVKNSVEKTLTHFEAIFEQELSDTFGE